MAKRGPKVKVKGSREWMREVVDAPERRALFVESLDKEIAQGDWNAYLRAYEHAYGRPPQALDVKHSGKVEGTVIYKAVLDGYEDDDQDLGPAEAASLPDADVPIGGTD